jgi:hypothetical protein
LVLSEPDRRPERWDLRFSRAAVLIPAVRVRARALPHGGRGSVLRSAALAPNGRSIMPASARALARLPDPRSGMKKGWMGSSPTASGQEGILVIFYAPNGSLPMRILVVEDDASLVDYLSRFQRENEGLEQGVCARRGLRGRPRLPGCVAGAFRVRTRASKASNTDRGNQIVTVVFPLGPMLLICGGHDAGHYGSCRGRLGCHR